MRWAVPSCCIIIFRWRFRAPSAGLSDALFSAAAASSCFLRARLAVREPRFGFLPERLMTSASAAATEASEAGGESSARSPRSALAESREVATFSARGALGRTRLSLRAARRDVRSGSECPFELPVSPGSPVPGVACPEGSSATSIGSRRVRRIRRPLAGAGSTALPGECAATSNDAADSEAVCFFMVSSVLSEVFSTSVFSFPKPSSRLCCLSLQSATDPVQKPTIDTARSRGRCAF
jgi:hypothetical protein